VKDKFAHPAIEMVKFLKKILSHLTKYVVYLLLNYFYRATANERTGQLLASAKAMRLAQPKFFGGPWPIMPIMQRHMNCLNE